MYRFKKKLEFVLDKNDLAILPYLIIFSVFVSFVEAIGFAAIMPFVSMILDTEDDFLALISNWTSKFLVDSNRETIILFSAVFLMVLYLFRAACLYCYFKTLAWYSESRFERLATKLYESYLNCSFEDFSRGNTSQKLKDLSSETARLTTLVSSLLLMLSEVFVFVFLYGFLVWLNLKITFFLTGVFIVVSTIIYFLVVKKIRIAGNTRALKQESFFKNASADFGNFKFIKINNKGKFSLDRFSTISKEWASANMVSATLGHIPRITFETLCFGIVISIVVSAGVFSEPSIVQMLPIISVYVLALYRVLPSFNRVFAALNEIAFQLKSLEIIHDNLSSSKGEVLRSVEIPFDNNIEFKNISVGYEGKPIINNLSFTVEKGDWVCISGSTGAGKSTLLDVIMGLSPIIRGKIYVDGKHINIGNSISWRSKFGLVSQNVYLFDGTIAENLAFGEQPDLEKINKLLDLVNLSKVVRDRGGLETVIGEGGINFSGGQKQRLAIVRALYKEPAIVALDEATNALDEATELEIINKLKNLPKHTTVIFITHSEKLKSLANLVINL